MKVLTVCLGNICRSPLAEGILRDKAHSMGLDWEVDSAGTSSWHIDEAPDPRSRQVASKYQIDISRQKARQFKPSDFDLYALKDEDFKKLGIRRLPRNLHQAVDYLKKDKLAEKVLGKVMLNSYIKYKNDEWERYHQAVTDWEVKEYLRLY